MTDKFRIVVDGSVRAKASTLAGVLDDFSKRCADIGKHQERPVRFDTPEWFAFMANKDVKLEKASEYETEVVRKKKTVTEWQEVEE